MKRLMMVMVIGLAMAATGFAQERGDSRFGGGRFNYNEHGASGHFSGQTVRGGKYEGGFEAHRRGFGGPSVGFGFAYTPAPAYVAPGPYYAAPAYCAPRYYPPVVGGVVVRRGFVRGHEFVGRDRDGRGFRR
jgi:hypothetical protein